MILISGLSALAIYGPFKNHWSEADIDYIARCLTGLLLHRSAKKLVFLALDACFPWRTKGIYMNGRKFLGKRWKVSDARLTGVDGRKAWFGGHYQSAAQRHRRCDKMIVMPAGLSPTAYNEIDHEILEFVPDWRLYLGWTYIWFFSFLQNCFTALAYTAGGVVDIGTYMESVHRCLDLLM